jgi:hypothetical protein
LAGFGFDLHAFDQVFVLAVMFDGHNKPPCPLVASGTIAEWRAADM